MSVVGKPGYKETEIGWIPSDWSVEKVESLADVDPESLSIKTAADFSFRYISLGDVDSGRLINGHENINFSDAPLRARRKVKAGDILFATVRPKLKGHYFARRVDGNVIASTGFAVVRARKEIASPEFLYQSLLSGGVDAQIEKLTAGSNYPAVNSGDVKGLLLTAPPLSEQQIIAAILTDVDEKLAVITRQIEATQILKQGLMQTLFSRGVGIQDTSGQWVFHTEFKTVLSLDIPSTWDVMRLGDIAPLIRRPVEIRPDATYPELGLRSYGKGTFHKPALLGSEVGNKRLFEIRAGDLLFSNVFAWEGAVAVAKPEDDGRYGSHRYITCTVDNSRADTSYIYRYLITPAGIALLSLASPGGAGRNKTLGLSALANITIPLPPLAEQQKISQILDGVEAKLQLLEAKRCAVESTKRGLMQKLLTGEWRVKLAGGVDTSF
ncbi:MULTISPECIES: restriction endonuclease subunit S [unclassified Pseudomonas]|uniref:restriction endonuclease subunit S n=1 Tax=unclassified Pseudomonas TaxID=196821 RepID=UPI000C87AF74|nr:MULTISPECIES: restriction endonuclease subunit S [unclassified Pseudomonas]PMU93288.1 hypothetical protein C1Y30_02245 [Pseudomonas sp. GW704-F3]PMU96177.1 hypothetical protein C1Y28_07280 [Pseudomonas sp. GW704-F5]PMU99969.1 hypothetical protein C1Y29_23715 [Pseudomonas sp. MPBD4-3]PMV32901.1 hypothetical protein C1Y27_11945 [Pseudomonas sp. GW704-F2]